LPQGPVFLHPDKLKHIGHTSKPDKLKHIGHTRNVAIASFHQLAYSHFGVWHTFNPLEQTNSVALHIVFSAFIPCSHADMARQSTGRMEGPDDSYAKLQKVSRATN